MKLALTLPGGTQIQPPAQVGAITQKAGNYGGNILGVATGVLFLAASIIALFFIVMGGIKWITSEGDPKNLASARTTLIYAAIGLGLVFLSYFIVSVLGNFVGVDLLKGQ